MIAKKMTDEVRMKQWVEIITERQASGMNINAWCKSKGISRHIYYYWQKKLRKMACEHIEGQQQTGMITSGFTQVNLMETGMSPDWI